MSRLLIPALLLLAASLPAQTGFVKSSGLPIPGATVTAVQGARKSVTTTDESGRYEFTGLAPGPYTFEIRMFGFKAASRQIEAGPGTSAIDWALELQARPAVQARSQAGPAGFRNLAQAGNQVENQIDAALTAAPQNEPNPALQTGR